MFLVLFIRRYNIVTEICSRILLENFKANMYHNSLKKATSIFNKQLHVPIVKCLPWLLEKVNMINCNVWFGICKLSWSIWLKSFYDCNWWRLTKMTGTCHYGNSVVYVTESIVCGHNIQPPPAPPCKQQCSYVSLKHEHMPCHKPPHSLSKPCKTFSQCQKESPSAWSNFAPRILSSMHLLAAPKQNTSRATFVVVFLHKVLGWKGISAVVIEVNFCIFLQFFVLNYVVLNS